ncbi:MAG: SusC/RagA family TonB-linked outer membrane protein [Chitinophagaceae bacterium]
MKRLYGLLFVLLTVSVQSLLAQNIEVQGKVTDATGSGIPDASVTIKGTRTGTKSAADGSFKLNAKQGAILVISAVGFEVREIAASNTNLNISLAQDIKGLSEVVVTGVGVATSKKKVAIDVASLSSKDVAKSTMGSVEQALIGKVAGAQVQINSGTPGSGASIILRGLNTLGSSYPLIMVDGLEVSDLNGIDLGNVERVEVVKGAAAGMLYGAQGANGVIQVFTKKGSRNRKPEINFTSQLSVGKILTGKGSLIAKYHSFETDAQGYATANGVRIAPDANGSWPSPDYIQSTDPFVQQNKPYKEQTFDHLAQAYSTAKTFNNSLSISGGGEKADYSFTISRYDEQNVLSNGYKRTSLASNIGLEPVKGLTFRNSLQTIFTSDDLLSGDADASIGGTSSDRFGLFNSFPFIDFTRKDSTGHYVVSANQGDKTTKNPLSERDWHSRNTYQTRILENANINYKFPKFVELDYKYGIEMWSIDRSNYYLNQSAATQSNVAFWGQNVNGSIQNDLDKFTKQNSLATIFIRTDFDKDFGWKLPIKTTTQLSYDYRKTEERYYFANGSILPAFPPYNITVAQNHTSGDFYSTFVTFGYLFNQSIDYKDLIGISGGFRSDYSSAFGAGSKPFTFPRGTIYFRPTELVKMGPITEMKLRAAYGGAGIQPGVYDRQATLNVQQLGAASTIYNPSQLPNPNLKVQQSRELEVGTDLTINTGLEDFLKKINISFSYWHHKNTDIIQPADLALTTGASKKIDNLTTITARGIDISLDAGVITNKDFDWQFGFRLGTAKSVATRIANGADIVNGFFTVRQGQELGLFSYQAPLSSVDQVMEDGKTPYIAPADRGKYQVVNGTVVDTATKKALMTNATDQKAAGSAYPNFTASFINTFTIKKNFIISFQLDWYHGNKIYNIVRQWLYRDRLSADFDKSVTINGNSGAYVNYYNSLYNNVQPSTWFVENGSFLRMRDVSLTYNLPPTALTHWAKNVSFTISGRNLFTITKYSGLDPEATTTADAQGNLAGAPGSYTGAIKGVDYFAVPNLRSLQVSLRLGF